MPCGYYRHLRSAVCFPAPSGCRLRGSVGLGSGSGRASAGEPEHYRYANSWGSEGSPDRWFSHGQTCAQNPYRQMRSGPPGSLAFIEEQKNQRIRTGNWIDGKHPGVWPESLPRILEEMCFIPKKSPKSTGYFEDFTGVEIGQVSGSDPYVDGWRG